MELRVTRTTKRDGNILVKPSVLVAAVAVAELPWGRGRV